jgi:hypothetical protein
MTSDTHQEPGYTVRVFSIHDSTKPIKTLSFYTDGHNQPDVDDIDVNKYIFSHDTCHNATIKIRNQLIEKNVIENDNNNSKRLYFWFKTVPSYIDKVNFVVDLFNDKSIIESEVVIRKFRYKFEYDESILENTGAVVTKQTVMNRILSLKNIMMYNEFGLKSNVNTRFPINPFTFFNFNSVDYDPDVTNYLPINTIMAELKFRELNCTIHTEDDENQFYFQMNTPRMHSQDFVDDIELQSIIENFDDKENVTDTQSSISRIHLRIDPIMECQINMDDVFNFFESVPNIPLMLYKTISTAVTKVDTAVLRTLHSNRCQGTHHELYYILDWII